jgi:hypothetical protein
VNFWLPTPVKYWQLLSGSAVTISWTALCPIPSSTGIAVSVTRLSSLMSASTLSLLYSVEAVQGRPLWGWCVMSVFPSLKCFTHRLTLLAPMQTSPYMLWSMRSISAAGVSSLTRNSITARCLNDTTLAAFFSRVLCLRDESNRRPFSQKGATTDGATCHTTHVALLLRVYS